jgi:hypothetical protein
MEVLANESTDPMDELFAAIDELEDTIERVTGLLVTRLDAQIVREGGEA